MILLHLGAGGVLPGEPWINLEKDLPTQLEAPTRRRCDVTVAPWPFGDASVDGVVGNHFFEHLDMRELIRVFKEAYRVLRPGGVLRAGVPDASYFRKVHSEDNDENGKRLFGDPWKSTTGEHKTYLSMALFYHEHRQALCEDSLWCFFAQAGFRDIRRTTFQVSTYKDADGQYDESGRIGGLMGAVADNRPEFTLYMEGRK